MHFLIKSIESYKLSGIFNLLFLFFLFFTFCAKAQLAKQSTSVSCMPVISDQLYVIFLDTTGSWDNSLACNMFGLHGEEKVLRFTAPCASTYKMRINGQDNCYPVGIRNSSGLCIPGGFSCLTPVSISYNPPGTFEAYYEFSALKDSTYEILIDFDYNPFWHIPATITTLIFNPDIENIKLVNINPDSITLTWSGTFDEVILEYGLLGFTPGQDTTPGIAGTIVRNVNSPYTISGLQNDLSYSLYLRQRCGTNFSPNSDVVRVRIPQPDSLIISLDSCPNSGFNSYFYPSYINKPGSWLSISCSNQCILSSPEVIRKFTAIQSGYHYLTKSSQGSTAPMFGCFYKESFLGLDEHNWQCIGEGNQNVPWSYSFGPLDSGVTYYILVKANQELGNCYNPGLFSASFVVDCPNTCPVISNHSVDNITTNSARLKLRQGSTLGYFVLEYGLSGFTPGTDSLPGIGGTVIITNDSYSDHIISGLTPGTAYDFHLRQYCDINNSFGSASVIRTFTTYPICSIAPDSISSNRPGNEVCKGQNVLLTQSGGLLNQGGVFRWYKDSCNSTSIGTGISITIIPDSSRYYFVVADDSCSASPCTSIYIKVNELPAVTILNLPLYEICAGDTVILNATVDSNLIYNWRNNGININAGISAVISVNQPGIYSLAVTDSNNCVYVSNSTLVQLVCLTDENPAMRFVSHSNIQNEIVPNPGTGVYSYFNSVDRIYNISVFNSLGELILEKELNSYENPLVFDISAHQSGLYFVKLKSEIQTLTKRIVHVSNNNYLMH